MNLPIPAVLSILMFLVPLAPAAAITLHVAPGGDDAASGSRAKPLATLTGARDALRALRKAGKLDQGATVEVHAGKHFLSRAFELTAEDSGTEKAPIVYRVAPGEAVTLTGGKEIDKWAKVSDPKVLGRLSEAARSEVVVADLKAHGVADAGKLSVRGFAVGSGAAEAELVFRDEPMTLSRWPNRGFRGATASRSPQAVTVDTDRMKRWTEESDPWVFAYWHHDWAELYEPIAGVDPATNTLLRSKEIKPRYGVTPGRARWYAFNLLSEIDQPGEYYIDRENGLLYFWPPSPGKGAKVTVTENLIDASELSHVSFRGFTLEACRGTALKIAGGSRCSVVGCTIRHSGHRAVEVRGGTDHKVYGCDIYHTGRGGILMTGGDRKSLTPARHNAENNHVHRYARRARTYHPAIDVSGVGNRIAHNLIHDGPHMALRASGNDHIVEFNEIHNVVEESGDAGAYYVGRDWTQRGNHLRYNYWHQIVGATGHGGMTIYLDDQHSGHHIYGNVFERCSQAVFIGGGDDNIVTNNLFLGCWRAAHLDNRGMGWQKKATDDPKGTLRSQFAAMPVDSELWKKRYPNLPNTLADQPNVPKRNVFARNISAGGVWNHVTEAIRGFQTIEDNLVFDDDPDWARLTRDAAGRLQRVEFKDPAAVEKIGFKPLPLAKMGLYQDEGRASWPVKHVVRPVELPEK